MDRRDFLKDVALWSAGALSSVPVFQLGRNALAAESPLPLVAFAESKDWTKIVAAAIAPLGGMKAFVKEGADVCVKPNASFDRTPEQAANAHPDVVKSVVQMCLDAGAKKVTVFDRTLYEKRRCYINSGIGPALETIKDKRLNLIHSDDRDYVPVKIEGGISFKKWSFHKSALHADAYINIPVAKHHGSAKLSLGLKNILGIVGGSRGKIHWSLSQGIADLNKVVRPTLTVIDATRILLRHGPSGGNLEDVAVKNMVIASADTVAADSYAAKTLFGMEPVEIPHIEAAYKVGLGEMNLSRIKVLRG